MRVLQVLPSIASSHGGPARSTLATCRAIAAADPGVSGVVLSTLEHPEPEWVRYLEGQLPPTMRLELHREYGRHTTSVSPGLLLWFHRHVRAFDLVVVRALLHPLSTACAALARRAGVPYVVTPHGTLSRYTFAHRNTRAKRLYYRVLESRTLDGAAAVQCTTEHEAEQVRELGCRAPVHVIPHPFEGGAEATPAERDPGLVLFLSRLDPMKGLDVLLPAFAVMCASRPDARLVVAGSGAPAYERALRAEVARRARS